MNKPAAAPSRAGTSQLRSWLLVLSVFLVGVSCGLPTIPFLDPPRDPGFVGGPENRLLTFTHNPNNDGDDFEGYELYYKLYTDEQSQQIDADANFIEATPRQPGPSRLVTRGFVRAAAVRELKSSDPNIFSTVTSDQPPHLPTEPTGASVEYRMDLQDRPTADANADVFVSWTQGGEQQRGFRRRSDEDAFSSDPTELKSFWNRLAYTPDDWDIVRMNLTEEIQSGTPARMSIVWYVLSYGIDGTSFAGYYSEPLRLDSAELILRTP